jgi:1-acyl-sn-glycerol-3-phosphate acyltransferase
MLTWNGAVPAALPPLTRGERLRGGLRLAGVLLVTLTAVIIFLIGRSLRRHLSRHVKFHFRAARSWARIMLRLMGVRRTVIGRPIDGPGVWLANHSGWADILALRSARLVNFVSKAEVRGWPAVGWIAEMCDTVFIERRRAAAGEQRNVLAERLRAGQLLCLFPEGTSSDGLRVLPFKSTLLSALYDGGPVSGAWVQPVTVNWIAPDGHDPAFYGWWGDMPFEGHVWDILCRSRGGRVEVVFHEPSEVSRFADRKALTRWAEDAVRGAKRVAAEGV